MHPFPIDPRLHAKFVVTRLFSFYIYAIILLRLITQVKKVSIGRSYIGRLTPETALALELN